MAFAPAGMPSCATPRASTSTRSSALMDEATAEGRDVARVHSGDPSLYGAIAEQMRRLDTLGIGYEVVPGVSSFQAAAAALKIELTPAGKNQTVILTRAAGRTGVPRQRGPRRPGPPPDRDGPVPLGRADARGRRRAAAALRPRRPRRRRLPRRLARPGRSSDCTLAEVAPRMADARITRTALILVGPMLDDAPSAESHLYDRSYAHLFRKASRENPPSGHKGLERWS